MLTEDNPSVYTVSQLNQEIRYLLENAFPPLWIAGEISNLACPASGHVYFTLKDAKAQVRCAFFNVRRRCPLINLANGQQVLVHAQISLYEGRGDYQLIINQIELAGDGALRRAFDLLKQRLAAEGLFAAEHKQPLPTLPKTVGVITSPTGAAIRDILSVLKRRFPALPVIIYPTAVQGAEAAPQIIKALATANQRQECDVLIVARGGGSLEDLWPFNEESVARAIYASALPIVTGIGHEIDFTIADFVADHRAATPSAAAELISPDQHKFHHDLVQLNHRLQRSMQHLLTQLAQTLLGLRKRLRHPAMQLREYTQRLDYLSLSLHRSIKNLLQLKQTQLTQLTRTLENLSPYATLKRGYAIVTDTATGEVLHHATQAKIGREITTQLAEGRLVAVVNKNEP